MTTRVSLAELAAADIPLRPAEAAAIVAEICRQYSAGQLRGIPSPAVIRMTSDGQVIAQGPVTTDDGGVAAAGHLLDDLLPGFDAPTTYRVSGGLRLVIARAIGALDLPPYASLDDFSAALRRFATSDLAAVARSLVEAWAQHRASGVAPAPALTISDIRRARRATGLTLDELSMAANVPAARLRELEWGYLRNWRTDEAARSEVVRYARASGLDEALVLSIAWPLIEQARRDAPVPVEVVPATALVPAGPQSLAPVVAPPKRKTRSRLAAWPMAAAAAALVAAGTFGVVTESAGGREAEAVQAEASVPPAQTQGLTAPEPAPAHAPAARPRPVTNRAAARHAVSPPARRDPPRHQSFFHRELFRIVIR